MQISEKGNLVKRKYQYICQEVPYMPYGINFSSDEMVDFLIKVLDSDPECFVFVDSEARVIWLNKAYQSYLNVKLEEAQGKPVVDVIPNTRLQVVVKTGIPELGKVQNINGRRAIVNRIPLFKDGKIIGAIGKVLFKTKKEFAELVSKLKEEVDCYKRELNEIYTSKWKFEDIITCSPNLIHVKDLAQKVAPVDVNVMILGESGSGKELLAHSIHSASTRSSKPFVCINCAAIPENIMESELFGYEPGAFTNAKSNGKLGKLEIANNGTVFLDEIGDMPPFMQAKLLRFLQEGELEKVGSVKPVSVNVRVICATNRNIQKMVEDGIFRADLYYRLSSIILKIPPLRERPEDIELLCDHFLKSITEKWAIPLKKIDKEALEILKNYYWPGNVRELQHLLETLCCITDGNIIKAKALPSYLFGQSDSAMLKNNELRRISLSNINSDGNNKYICSDVINSKEKELLEEVLRNTGGNKRKAAEMLGIHRTTLYYKLRKYNMQYKVN